MTKQSYVKVECPKCGRVYAIPKGSTRTFPCPGKNCNATVNQQSTAKTTAEATKT